MRGLRYPVIVGIVVIVLALLFGGQWVYNKYVVERPVVDALNLPEVESTKFIEDTGTVVVKLKEVENLKETYWKIQEKIQGNNKAADLKLVITDNRSQELEDAFYVSQFAVHQAIMRGDFISMYDNIRTVASDFRLDRYAVYIDSENVYLQFHRNGNNLYEVISREVPGKEDSAPLNGSDET